MSSTNDKQQKNVEPLIETDPSFFDRQTGPFFRKVDWWAFITTFLITFGVYFHTLAPTVTLEDSGELAVASDYLGVPHPPGYPIWTLITWFFQWIFHWVKYFGQPDSSLGLVGKSFMALLDHSRFQGYPNPAWSVALMSAFFGALACALLAMLVSRSGSDILRGMQRETEILGYGTETLLCWVCGLVGGLLFAFSSVLWSQSVIVEVYSLNAFFLVYILLLTYRWMCRPHENYLLYTVAFTFGLGLTNHQALLFLAVGLLAAIWFRDRALFRDSLAGIFWVAALLLFYEAHAIGPQASPEELRSKQSMYTVMLIFLLAPAGLFLIERKLMTEWKRFLTITVCAILGLSFYAYLPFSSEQNPPMNWGYPRTMEGFWHAISRGQYEKINPVANFGKAVTDPFHFFKLLHEIITKPGDYISVVSQFTWPISLLVLFPFIFLYKLNQRSRKWLLTTLITFTSLTVIFAVFQWPDLDVQTLFIGRVQYIQAHAIFSLWISYGAIFLLTILDAKTKGNRLVKYAGLLVTLLLPGALLWQNAYDKQFIKIVGGCEQNGHDFGWQFGAWELRGAKAILEDLPPEERSTYPTPDYPSEMETNAIFFGGTDPGRFVPTYMIYSADYRSDVYLITQNALADNTYMNVMRDLYGDRIWIPAQRDSNFAFQKYVQDVQSGRTAAGADVNFEGGRVSVQGVQGVMMINGILAQMIFEANKTKHAFYVEESYVIPWMYPYMTPNGLIMKINAKPVDAITPEMVKNDRALWDWYVKRLMGNNKFLRDVVARKTFSKLRSALAGLYAARHMFEESEYAFKQSIALYPLSPEANFRLADIYMQQFRFSDARVIIENFLKEDPDNDKVEGFLGQIKDLESSDVRRRELEGSLSKGSDLNAALELCGIYRKMNLQQLFNGLTMNIINQSNLPPVVILQVAQMYADSKQYDMLATALERYLQREPSNPKVWIDYAAVQTALQRTNEALQSIKKAVDLGGEPVRDILRKDNRFDAIRQTDEFRKCVPAIQANMDLPLNMPLPGL